MHASIKWLRASGRILSCMWGINPSFSPPGGKGVGAENQLDFNVLEWKTDDG